MGLISHCSALLSAVVVRALVASRVLDILFLPIFYDLVEFFGDEVVSETLPLRNFFTYGFSKLLFALFHEFLEGNLRR